MSLGIFNRLFTLLEGECQHLDALLASKQGGEGVGGATFQRYTSALKELSQLKEQRDNEQKKATLLSQLSTHLSLTVMEPQQNPVIQRLRQEASAAQGNLSTLVTSHNIV